MEAQASDRIAVVTGTSSGIGQALAAELLERGWEVVGVSRRPVDLEDPRYHHVTQDLAVTDDLEATLGPELTRYLERAPRTRLGLVNNAADPGQLVRIDALAPDVFLTTLATDVVAPVWLMGFCLRAFGGAMTLRIVNVTSGAATGAFPGLGDYGAAKAGLRAASLVAAVESSRPWLEEPRDLSILSYSPGMVDTPMQAMARARDGTRFPLAPVLRRAQEAAALAAPRAVALEIAAFLEGQGPPGFSEARFAGAEAQGQRARLLEP
jgi:benzil reductase ((S)-benzoin forming)